MLHFRAKLNKKRVAAQKYAFSLYPIRFQIMTEILLPHQTPRITAGCFCLRPCGDSTPPSVQFVYRRNS